ncbi:MAG: VOC family protein [Pseudomonadota bacterium]|nr:VOC family protein [Pseudomonadota bacterium]
MVGNQIKINKVDHIGIRVVDAQTSINFYKHLGFELHKEVDFDSVIILKNENDVEINLIVNGTALKEGQNILMDVAEKYPGYTHLAFNVDSIVNTIEILSKNQIAISQGPVSFGDDGHVSVFLRDPDRNVVELRGRVEDSGVIEGLVHYDPNG